MKLIPQTKAGVKRLLKVGFIKTVRYVEWLSNIVSVTKKNGQVRVCIDYRDLNLVTPKDEYDMPVADMLVYAATNHAILTFMDGLFRI